MECSNLIDPVQQETKKITKSPFGWRSSLAVTSSYAVPEFYPPSPPGPVLLA